jgi:hypothetical protein
LLFLLIFPVLTCNNFAPGGGGGGEGDYDPDGITYTDVVYSPDGKSVTIYLEGSVPVTNRQSRALHRELAVAGHDYFEVVFYNSAEPGKFVRAAWELKTDARIRNVTKNVNYEYTSVSAANGAMAGAAILFVGKKTDRTILGLGRLKKTDDGGNTSYVSDSTKSVTFSVAALDCGVKYTTVPAASPSTSFYTDTNFPGPDSSPNQGDPIVPSDWDNVTTTTMNNSWRFDSYTFSNSDYKFPMYRLVEGGVTHARYYFRTVGTTADVNLYLSNFLDGIILAGPIEHGKKQPRFPIPGGGFQYFSERQDEKTTIMAGNNTTAGVPFENPVEVKFNTSDTVRGSVFAYVFEVPVYPLSNASDPGTWFIRASYDSNWWDLDSGKDDSKGGAVLMKTGENETAARLRIRVLLPPEKYLYSQTLGRDFNVDGLLVVLEEDTSPYAFVRFINPYNELTYELGSAEIYPNSAVGETDGQGIKPTYTSINEVIVYYREPGGIPYEASFMIICDKDSLNTYTSIPTGNYRLVSSFPDFQAQAINSISTAGTYVFILTDSFNFSNRWPINGGESDALFIFVAGSADSNNPDVRLGRTSAAVNADSAFGCQFTRTGFYFGKWPFNAPLMVGATNYARIENIGYTVPGYPTFRYSSWEYAINADGPIAQITPAAPAPAVNATNNYMTVPFIEYFGGSDGRMYRITLDEKAVTVVPQNTTRFY